MLSGPQAEGFNLPASNLPASQFNPKTSNSAVADTHCWGPPLLSFQAKLGPSDKCQRSWNIHRKFCYSPPSNHSPALKLQMHGVGIHNELCDFKPRTWKSNSINMHTGRFAGQPRFHTLSRRCVHRAHAAKPLIAPIPFELRPTM